MKKIITITILLLACINFKAQDKLNYFYKDTIFEINQIKIEYKGAMSYKDKFKSPVYFTNLSDSFKVIDPKNIRVIKDDYNGCPPNSNLIVIAPKTTKRYRLLFEPSDFKKSVIKQSISKIQTSGKISTVFNPDFLILNQESLDAIKIRNYPVRTVGDLRIRLKNFKYYPTGKLVVNVGVAYTGVGFLGMHVKKIKLLSTNGKTLVNMQQNTGSLFYKLGKDEMGLTLTFENPYGNAIDLKGDKVVFEDIFVEYELNTSNEVYEFNMTKSGEGKGNPPNEEKEASKDIEVIED